MLYDWPIKRVDRTHPRLGTLGEFRGLGPNDITRLHSGMDIAEAGSDVEVFSPDTGLVRRYEAATNGNPSGGGGPIRVGHFGFNHITDVLAEPGQTYKNVTLPQDLPIYVVDPNTPAFAPRPGIANPKKDADFRQGTVTASAPAVAYRKIAANNYELVSFWPRTLPIGKGVQPTDLHCVYYESNSGPYDDPANVANPLEVFRNYKNDDKPVAESLQMYTQVGNQQFLDLGQPNQAAIHTAAMGGLDFKLWAYSPFDSRCGVYQIEYEILMHLGRTTNRLNVWKFHKNPANGVSFDLVDQRLSTFITVFNKQTVYIITNSRNGNINADLHWEIENAGMWPDGCYAIKVWLKNIKKSVAVGTDPQTNERLYGAEWKVETVGQNKRKVSVTDKFKERANNWRPRFKGCPKETPPQREGR